MSHVVAFVYAHPDDETFLSAALIRTLADEGHRPLLLLSTPGDAGNKNGAYAHLTREELAAKRALEMQAAADVLGLETVEQLGYPDGRSGEAEEEPFVAGIAEFLNRHRAQVVVTFPPDGGNFHPDHVAISRMTAKAVLGGRCPAVEKLYYAFSETLHAEGRRPAVVVDTEPYWPVKKAALEAHESQILAIRRFFGDLQSFPEARRYEAFALAWQRGEAWPQAEETSVAQGVQGRG